MVMLPQSTSAARAADGTKVNGAMADIAPVAASQNSNRADIGKGQLMMVRFALPPLSCQMGPVKSRSGQIAIRANPAISAWQTGREVR
jgi:hypothetical protein